VSYWVVDEFEQRAFVEQGSGVKPAYTYDAQNRRLNVAQVRLSVTKMVCRNGN